LQEPDPEPQRIHTAVAPSNICGGHVTGSFTNSFTNSISDTVTSSFTGNFTGNYTSSKFTDGLIETAIEPNPPLLSNDPNDLCFLCSQNSHSDLH